MHPLTLRRLSGLAAITAGPLCLLGGLLHPIVDGDAHSAAALAADHTLGSVSLLAGTVLLLLGLPGVYGWLAPRLGWLGLAGYLLYFVGNVLNAVPHLVIMGFAGQHLAREHPELIADGDVILDAPAFEVEQVVTGLGFLLGLLLFSIALVLARGLPRWIGWVGVASVFVMFVPLPVVEVLTGLQIELLRGVLIVALGVLTVRSARAERAAYDDRQVATAAR